MTSWKPIETAPKDTPVLAWCVETEDCAECSTEGSIRLCLFHAHADGFSSAGNGLVVVEWGGSWEDSWEDGGGFLPDWWFRVGSEFEEAANPTHWMPLPPAPENSHD